MSSPSGHLATKSPRGLTAVGIFLVFGAVMATLAGTSLRWPRTYLDDIWILNPPAHRELAPYGPVVGLLFLLLGAILAVAAAGWFKRRLWGWWLAVAVIAIQVLGDLVNAFSGRAVEGAIGVTIAGLLLFYLTRPQVRAAFDRK
jgi:hypothetical protein